MIALLAMGADAYAQSNELKIDKNRTIDFLFVTDKKDVEKLKPKYFKDVFPPAQKIGFKRATYFRINKKPISGEYFPYVVAIGSWPGDWEMRQALFAELKDAVPDIRSRRLDIWNSFNMINVSTTSELDIRFDPSKIYVLSAYWQKNKETFDSFREAVPNQVAKQKGKVVFLANETQSMFGYALPASMMMISQWETQADFDTYYTAIANQQSQATSASSEFYLSIPAA